MAQRTVTRTLPESTRLAVLYSMADDTITATGPAGEKVKRNVTRWVFLVDAADAGREYDEVEALSGARFDEQSQEARWAAALLEKSVDDLAESGFDDRDLIAKPCVVDVIHKDGNQGRVFVNVGDVRALSAAQKKNKDSVNTIKLLNTYADPESDYEDIPF